MSPRSARIVFYTCSLHFIQCCIFSVFRSSFRTDTVSRQMCYRWNIMLFLDLACQYNGMSLVLPTILFNLAISIHSICCHTNIGRLQSCDSQRRSLHIFKILYSSSSEITSKEMVLDQYPVLKFPDLHVFNLFSSSVIKIGRNSCFTSSSLSLFAMIFGYSASALSSAALCCAPVIQLVLQELCLTLFGIFFLYCSFLFQTGPEVPINNGAELYFHIDQLFVFLKDRHL